VRNLPRRVQLASLVGDRTISRIRGEYRSDPYRLRKLPATLPGLYIDVGANIGDMVVFAGLMVPQIRIIAVEAMPHLAWLVRYNLFLNGIDEVACDALSSYKRPRSAACVLNRAVDKEGGNHVRMSLRVNDSQLATVSNKQTVAGRIYSSVPTISLAQLLEYRLGADPACGFLRRRIGLCLPKPALQVSLLKVDCEGCEFEAIPALGNAFQNRTLIPRFAGEVHHSIAFGSTMGSQHDKASEGATRALFAALSARGCSTTLKKWEVNC